MATTEAEPKTRDSAFLARIRRLEALGARAWPAAEETYDGVWVRRATPDHPSGRLNSVTPLDPDDANNIAARIDRLCFEHGAFKRPLRLTPLAPSSLFQHIRQHGWSKASDVAVMTLNLPKADTPSDVAVRELSLEDYVRASNANHGSDGRYDEALGNILSRIKGQPSFLEFSTGDGAVGSMLLVRDFGQAGILDFAIHPEKRGQGMGKNALNALIFYLIDPTAKRNTNAIWLQVETQNMAALGLYSGFGFETIYHYEFWRPSA